MSKSDWLNLLEVLYGVCGYLFTRALAKFSAIKKEWESLKKSQTLQEQSLKKAHERIDQLEKKIPHGGEI